MNSSHPLLKGSQMVLAISIFWAAQATPLLGQSQLDILQEISLIDAEAGALVTSTEELIVQLQPSAWPAGNDEADRDDGRSSESVSRDPYIHQCYRDAYDDLVERINQIENRFETANRITSEYQERPLIQAFNESDSRMASVAQAQAALEAANDVVGALRAAEIQLLPALQAFLYSLQGLESNARSQLENFPFYLLSVGLQTSPHQLTIQADPGEALIFLVRIDAAMSDERVLPASPINAWVTVPHRWESDLDLPTPITLLPGSASGGSTHRPAFR